MRKIINEIWALERFDAVKLAKYTRCLFQATLPLDDNLAMNLLDEACGQAKELREVSDLLLLPPLPSLLLLLDCTEIRRSR